MSKLVSNLNSGIILQCLIVAKLSTFTGILANANNVSSIFSVRGIGRSMAVCLSGTERMKCLEKQLVHALETAVQDNTTWKYHDFLLIEKSMSNGSATNYGELVNSTIRQSGQQQHIRERSLGTTIGEKLLQLVQTRSIRLQLPKAMGTILQLGSGISDAVDDFTGLASAHNGDFMQAEEGTVRVFNGLVDDKIELISSINKNNMKIIKKKKDKIWYLNNKNPLKGRKKKDKDKHMAMMGGVAMMAMVAQLFLGKVILIAGAAFVMAKVALLVSILGSLKKGTSGSSGSTEHVIVTGGGGGTGHGHDSGWHRSMPYDYTSSQAITDKHDNVQTASKATANRATQSLVGGLAHKPIYYNDAIVQNVEGNYDRKHSSGFL